MLRYMKTHRQEKETLRAAVLSMFPICPIRLLPPFPNVPSMSLELMVQALTIAVETIAECR